MMQQIDLNCDLGERYSTDNGLLDQQLMPYLSSCNIACGGHAGTPESMKHTVRLALHHGLNIGAHPSFPDKVHFGRKAIAMSPSDLGDSLTGQITTLKTIVEKQQGRLTHVKPHGALYNLAADDLDLAILICEIIAGITSGIALLGMASSAMAEAAAKTGLMFWPEAFVDRRYEPNLRLRNRTLPGAILNAEERIKQLHLLVLEHKVEAPSGKKIDLVAQSLCLHSDTPDAIGTARQIVEHLTQQHVYIRPIR